MTDKENKFNIIALMDQAGAALKDISKPLFTFYAALIAEGFSKEEALKIVIAYLINLLSSAKENN